MTSKVQLTTGSTILFTGDSITDADRELPAYQPFGFGYVHFVANHLLAKYPELNLGIINTGIGGDTIYDLESRWEDDCIQHEPDVLSVLIGINDVWWRYASSEGLARGLHADQYEFTYRRLLLRATEEFNCQLVLGEPFMFCNDRENQMLGALRDYIKAVRKLADEFDAVLVPLQSCIDEQIKQVPAQKWSADCVHPYIWAHAWIAQRWLEATSL
ncbi:MAG: SGNH/GDSL hydrolase family protein [Planctomycetota bacterium]|jgi:lysophospholipase L1-like esterase